MKGFLGVTNTSSRGSWRVRGLFKDNDELHIPFIRPLVGREGVSPLDSHDLDACAVLGGVDLLNKIFKFQNFFIRGYDP